MTILSDKIQANITNQDKHLHLPWHNITGNKSELSLLQKATNLTTLDLSQNEIKSIEFLINLPELTELNLCNNQISDISCLLSLTQLRRLIIDTQNLPFLPYWYPYLRQDKKCHHPQHIINSFQP